MLREGWRGDMGGGGVAAFIFSASHVIFIVNKTHLALLSEQGLAEEASIHRNRRLVGEEEEESSSEELQR